MRNRAGSLLLISSGVAAFTSLMMLQLRPAGLEFAFPLLLCVAFAVATIAIGANDHSVGVGGSGVIGLVGGLVLGGWIWRSQYALYPDDAIRACIEALGFQNVGLHVGFRRSVFPPGLFCSPSGRPEELVTSLATVTGWTLVLVAIAAAFIVSIWVARKAESRASLIG